MAQRKTKKPNELITGQSSLYAPKCPACGASIHSQATVERFDEPQGWSFFGRRGERWEKCRGSSGPYKFIHFLTLLNGRYNHRLAWIVPAEAEAEAVQESFL